MKTKFISKLNYSLFLVLAYFALDGMNSYGQIVYTDIEPDFVGDNLNNNYDLDLNNDGTVDFTFSSYESSQALTVSTSSPLVNAFYGLAPWYCTAKPMNNGDLINNLGSNTPLAYWCEFTGGIGLIQDWPDIGYFWTDSPDKYLGLRFNIMGNIHYGWARMDLTNSAQWTIKDYAYNSVAGEGIIAGQTTLTIEDNTLADKVKITTSNNLITIHNLTALSNYNLYTITGNKVLDGTISKKNNQISTITLAKGIYVLELRYPDRGDSIIIKLVL
ncbi:T9SS type A sorting domain-containing protein [Mangrovimonas aestuarii]|uniref:T9SS type A sorting domain-containing protein n=1 Tax=Mangrovimonas aestuarii TaxID=3018443 RepID=UPI002378243F|nr:T9SS type A sorting domain-containing protein [Mangrovimonas aestuarii]